MEIAIATRQQLARQGWKRGDIERELENGRILRIRPGYFARPAVAPELIEAVRLGGVATGPTALRHFGLWAPEDARLHVAVAPNASRLPARGDQVVVHWRSSFQPVVRTGPDFRPIVPVAAAVEHAVAGLSRPDVIAVLDSALHERRLSPASLATVLAALPRAARRSVEGRLDARAESGAESICRVLLHGAGIHAEIQVVITGVGRVDLLVDGWLIIEVDGAHSTPTRPRCAGIGHATRPPCGWASGSLRLTYPDVVHSWPRSLATIRAVLADGAPAGARSAFRRPS